jgi:hypothetical protein
VPKDGPGSNFEKLTSNEPTSNEPTSNEPTSNELTESKKWTVNSNSKNLTKIKEACKVRVAI